MKFIRNKFLVSSLSTLLVLNLLIISNPLAFVGDALLLFLLLIYPGSLILLSITNRERKITLESILYIIGLSIAFLIVDGLLINTFGPLVGIARPLSVAPLLVTTDLLLIGLLFIIKSRSSLRFLKLPSPIKPSKADYFLIAYGVALLIISAAGAEILNNNGSSFLPLLSEICFALYVLLAVLLYKRIRSATFPVVLFLLSLSIILSYSLRSNYLMGWDIHQEYFVFQLTNAAKHWSIGRYISPYNACLSITILPTIFSSFLHISGVYIYKIIFQILFSFSPLIVFVFARKIFTAVDRRFAFLAAVLLISQTWFFEQAPALIRQEVALYFFGLLLLVIFEKKKYKSDALALIFGLTIVLTHYSTAYVVLALLFLYVLVRYILRLHKNGLVSMRFLVILLLAAFLWQSQLTTTSQNLISTIKQTIVSLPQSFSAQNFESSLSQASFSSNYVNTNRNINSIYRSKTSNYKDESGSLYNTSDTSSYVPQPIPPLTVEPKVGPTVSEVLINMGKLTKLVIVDTLPLVGLVILTFYALKKIPSQISGDYLILTLCSFALIGLILILPLLKFDYNLTRLYLQSLYILAPITIYGGIKLLWKIKGKYLLLSLAIALFFLYSTGLIFYVTGSQAPVMLTNTSQDYQYYYTNSGEITSARWLSSNRTPGLPIYADQVADLNLIAYGDITYAHYDIFPTTITKNSYVYLSTTNLNGITYESYDQSFLQFNTPAKFLSDNKNQIYTSGTSVIYK